MLITVIALFVAVPIGLAAAIYLSEYASARARGFFKPLLEILVGIPTVIAIALFFRFSVLAGMEGATKLTIMLSEVGRTI